MVHVQKKKKKTSCVSRSESGQHVHAALAAAHHPPPHWCRHQRPVQGGFTVTVTGTSCSQSAGQLFFFSLLWSSLKQFGCRCCRLSLSQSGLEDEGAEHPVWTHSVASGQPRPVQPRPVQPLSLTSWAQQDAAASAPRPKPLPGRPGAKQSQLASTVGRI